MRRKEAAGTARRAARVARRPQGKPAWPTRPPWHACRGNEFAHVCGACRATIPGFETYYVCVVPTEHGSGMLCDACYGERVAQPAQAQGWLNVVR